MSLLRLVHLGDLHLQATHPRNADRLAALDQVIEREQQVNMWLIPGDLFHARSTVQDRNDLAVRLTRMADRAPVLLCYGNHDAPGDLDIYGALRARHFVTVIDKPMVVDLPVSGTMDVAIFVLPYPNKAGLVAYGVDREHLHGETQKAMDLIFMDAAAQLETFRQAGRPTLMMGHVSVAGAVSSVGQPQIGTELEISQAHLDRLGPIPKLLNHIHKHQVVGGATYAGSLCRLDWGECEDKFYQVATFDSELEERGWAGRDVERSGKVDLSMAWQAGPWRIEAVKALVPPMYHVECENEPCGNYKWTVKRGPDGETLEMPTSVVGCDVRVRLRYLQAERAALDGQLALIRDRFQDARRLEIEPVVVPDRALRAPKVVAAQTLDEKLAAWAEVSGVSWAGEIVARAAELQAGESDAVVAGVRERMARLADVGGLLNGEALFR